MALVFTVLCGAVAVTLGLFINYFAKGNFIQNTDAVLTSEIRYIQAAGIRGTPEGRIYIPFDENGKLPFNLGDNKLKRFSEGIISFEHPNDGKIYAAKIHTFTGGARLLVGFDITNITKDFARMQAIGLASIIFVLLVIAVAYVISIFVVTETNKIAATAQDIMHTGDLSRRVEVKSRWDDLGNMAAVLNLLLERTEELLNGVRRVSDNIAHDLRTPLTRLRGHIEDLKKHDDRPEYDDLLLEADHMLTTFNALLRISRIEGEKQRSKFEQIDLTKVLYDVIGFYEPLAEDRNIKLTYDLDDISMFADRDLLFQAFANLLDNAIKYTPDSGEVSMTLKCCKKEICVTIQDNGPGVSEDETRKIFTRFYRSECCRSTPGIGLGLSLVKAVIDLHNGSIEAQNTNPGLKIVTVF